MNQKIEKWDDVHGSTTPDDRLVAFLESTTDSYAVLQLKHIDETEEMRFMPYSYVQKLKNQPTIDHYDVVYHGSLEQSSATDVQLEDLYRRFNIERPEDFKGHSMSVSDIVALNVAGEVSCYYVDSFGFKEMSGFINPDNYLKSAEMSMEDDYGMIDGVINNGKSVPLEEANKPSVLEQLKNTAEKEIFRKPPGRPMERDLE